MMFEFLESRKAMEKSEVSLLHLMGITAPSDILDKHFDCTCVRRFPSHEVDPMVRGENLNEVCVYVLGVPGS